MPEAVPNSVYLRTQQGLKSFVSAAAVERVLSDAMADAGVDPSRIHARQMRALLLGPVLDELSLLLPRSGLERRLDELAAGLMDDAPPVQPISAAVKSPPTRLASAQVARARTARVVTGVRTQVRPPRPASATELQQAVLQMAAIDSITLVAAVRQSGQVEFSRGSGDVDSLARLGMLALSLLKKNGPLRMFYLALEDSGLLLFPYGSDALLLTGKADLNVGAVVTAFDDLVRNKEES